MLYTAEHLSLACLEVLVHLDKNQLPRDYVWSKTELLDSPELLSTTVPTSVTACQVSGATWIRAGNQLAIRVPSVIIPDEYNVLLNPNHTAYASVPWSEPRPFNFDPRLLASEPRML